MSVRPAILESKAAVAKRKAAEKRKKAAAARRAAAAEKERAANSVRTESGELIGWDKIRSAAENGAPEREIMLAFGLSESSLVALGQMDRFKREIEVGGAKLRLALRSEIRDRSQRTKHGAGSVNILALMARNNLGWDRATLGQEEEPDLSTAREKLRQGMVKLSQQRSQIEGRVVTPADLLFHESEGRWPWDPSDEEAEG